MENVCLFAGGFMFLAILVSIFPDRKSQHRVEYDRDTDEEKVWFYDDDFE